MEIVKFETMTWHEIPSKENPAFDYVYENQRLMEGNKGRRKSCLLICRSLYEQKLGSNGFTLIEVPKVGDIIKRGLFWNLEDAEICASAMAKK